MEAIPTKTQTNPQIKNMQKNSSMEAIPTKTQAKNIQKNSSKEAIPTKTIQNHTHKTKNTIHAKCMILLYGHIFNSILF